MSDISDSDDDLLRIYLEAVAENDEINLLNYQRLPNRKSTTQDRSLEDLRAKLHELQRASQHEKKERQKYSREIEVLKRSLSREKEITKKLKLDQDDLKRKHEIQTGKFEAFKVEVAEEKEKSKQERAQQDTEIQGLKRQMELLMANQNVKDLALTQLDTQHGTLDVKCTSLRVDVDNLDMRSHRQENDINHVANCVEGLSENQMILMERTHPEAVAVPAVDDGNDDHMWVAEENI